MKRLLLICHCLASFWLATQAANMITVTGSSGHPGDEVTVSVAMSGTDAVTALEMQLPLDEWLSFVDGSCSLAAERSDGHSVTAKAVDGVLKIYAYSLALKPFKGASGELLSFRLRLGEAPGDFSLAPTIMASNANGATIPTTTTAGTATILCPALRVATEQIDFGHVPIRSSYEGSLTLQNYGNEPLTISNIVPDNDELTVSPSSLTIPAGGSASTTITYSPLKRSPFNATLTIESNAVNAKIYNKWQTANAIADPFSVNELHIIGAQGVSDTEVEIALKMNNMEPIVGAQVSFQLPEALRYVEGSAAMTSRSNGHTVTTTTGDNNQLTIFVYSTTNKALKDDDGCFATFRLSLEGKSGWYWISPKDVILSNTTMENMTSDTSGDYVQIQSPTISGNTSLSFGEQDATKPLTVTYNIYNIGQAALTVEKVTFLADGFRVVTPLPVSIAPSQSADIEVEYIADKFGDFSTTMNIYSNDPATRVKGVEVSGTAFSPNELTISGSKDGEDYSLNIDLINDSPLTAVQFDITVDNPASVGTPTISPSARLTNHTANIYDMDNGTWKVLVFSMSNAEIASGEGEICSIQFPAITSQDDITFTLSNIVLSSKDGQNMLSPVLTKPQSFTIEGEKVLMGDVNGDGKIDSQDILIVINMVLNKETNGNKAVADMNDDGKIDSQDVLMVINKVLGK